MKRIICLFATAALLASCGGNKQNLVQPEPSWYANQTYFQEKNSLYENLYLFNSSIVMVGDDIMDRGEWALFYADTCIKNRGIALEGTEHTLYRMPKIAAQKPAKIFVYTGMRDILYKDENGNSFETAKIIENSKKIMEVAAKASKKKSELYYIGIIPNGLMNDEQVAQANEINEAMKTAAGSYTYIDAPAAMTENGRMRSEYSFNGLNLNGAGYEALANVLAEHIGKEALNKAADRDYPEITDYYKHRVSIFNSLPKQEKPVVFLGNSHTNNAQWQELMPVVRCINRGISGDIVEGIYNRLDDIEEQTPIAIFLQTGANNFINDPEASVSRVWTIYEMVIKAIRQRMPYAELYVQATLPLNPKSRFYEGFNAKAAEINKVIAAAAPVLQFRYVDIATPLMDENGDLRSEFTFDGLHLNADGYFVWMKTLIETGAFYGMRQAQESNLIIF